MAGLRADVLSGTVFFEPGSFAALGGGDIWETSSNIYIDPTRVGPGAADRAGLWSHGQAMFFYLLADPNKNVVGLCSPGYDYGDIIIPDGYSVLRKHPFMTCWRADQGGIPGFHFEGIQNPRIRLTFPYSIGTFTHARNVPGTLSLAPFIPVAGGARMALLRTTVRAAAGNAGTGYIGPDASHLVPLGTANPTDGLQSTAPVEVRVDSVGNIAYMVNAPGVFIDVIIEGWVVTEVTN